MNRTINAAVYEKHGNPAEVLHVETRPWPTAATDEAVVKMRAAPINPADLNQIEGKYPVRPELPATPGFEGAGVVVEVGAQVKDLTTGALVILPHNIGTWRDAVAVKAEDLVVVPEGIDPVQAAMLKINPLTAWRLLHDYVDLQKGDWLIQNAANSAAGRDVIQIAHELGYKTVNVVRRAELIDELRAEGGDVVLVDGEGLRDEVKSATSGAFGPEFRGRRQCPAPCQLSYFRWHARELWRNEFAAAQNSDRASHFQRPAFSRHLDQQMVRQRHSGRADGDLSTAFRNGAARSAANESRKSLSAERSQNRSCTCRARQTQRQNHSRVRVVT
jgi:hypothetical protein